MFTFTSPCAIILLSEDGVQIPKVYLVDDISLQQSDPTFTPSAIETINDQYITTYLTQFAAANSVGNIEPNVDWRNDLMFSWAAHIQNDYSIFQAKLSSFPATLLPLASRTVLEIQQHWQGMIRLGLMGQMIYDYQLKQQLDLLFNYLA